MSTTITTTTAQEAKLLLDPQADQSSSLLKEPLKLIGKWDHFESFAVTPVIGQEFPEVQLKDLLERPDSDEYFKELATIISRRNVVFFRKQDLTLDQLKQVGEKIHALAGAPKVSGHHIHPLPNNPDSNLPKDVKELNSKDFTNYQDKKDKTFRNDLWHSDITFEPVPSDYAALQIHTLPPSGGDTLWASGYEIYERLSEPIKKLLEKTTALHDGSYFNDLVKYSNFGDLITETPRGHPLNIGGKLQANHPVIRTNPVTGWKSVFLNKQFTKRINELTEPESDLIFEHVKQLLYRNHDLTVRFKWNKNDLAIWDNRSTFHTITFDYGKATRIGNRVCTLGEKPFFSANSTSKSEGLQKEKESGIEYKF